MASVTTPMDAPAAPHGTKRAADGNLDGEQRLSKRFDLLNLDHCNSNSSNNTRRAARLYIPVASTQDAAKTTTQPASDAMLVEDTPHRVYIHDLAAELSDADSDSDHPVFLPDIEKHLARSRIPRYLLQGPAPTPTEHNQVILYNVPASLSVPEEHDSVRKAIVEARQRIREKQTRRPSTQERTRGEPASTSISSSTSTYTSAPTHDAIDEDTDAMDLD